MVRKNVWAVRIFAPFFIIFVRTHKPFFATIVDRVPVISTATFWDIDPASLSFEDSFEWVILRVFDKGSLAEVIGIRNFYGSELVKKTLTSHTGYLPSHSILLAKALFQLTFQDFKCLEKRPFQTRFSKY